MDFRHQRLALAAACAWLALSGGAQSQDQFDDMVDGGLARGVVLSSERVDIVTDLGAPVEQVPFREGGRFEKGAVLIAFDCQRYAAELAAAEAARQAAQVELRQKQHLLRNGAAGRGEVDMASANSARASAEIDVVRARMDGCVIAAPFDGRVVARNIDPAEMPVAGEALMTIIDDGRLEIEMIVPSMWLRDLARGTYFLFEVDETGTEHRARVDRIGAEVDPVSQTVKLYAVFEEGSGGVLAGMSGNARFSGIETGFVSGAVQ